MKSELNRYLPEIISILSRTLTTRGCRIYLFGSRAVGQETETSDFDIAVEASGNIAKELSVARELIEASNIPFVVDLVDLRSASEKFARRVREEGILIWSN